VCSGSGLTPFRCAPICKNMEDIKVDRKMSYDSRRKILTIVADVKSEKANKHKIENIQYVGEETIKSVADQFKKKKEHFQSQIDVHTKEVEAYKTQIKELKKKLGLELTPEEQKIKDAVEKINNSIQLENIEAKLEGSQDMINMAKDDLKDTNVGFEELKQKVTNIKL